MMMTPFARLPRLSFKARATARATAENAAMMPAVEKPRELTSTMTSAIYSTTVRMESTKVEAARSSRLLLSEAERAMICTMRMTTSPKTRKASVRTMVSPVLFTNCSQKAPTPLTIFSQKVIVTLLAIDLGVWYARVVL